MSEFGWIISGGLGMSLIALSGGFSLLFSKRMLDRLLLPLVALAAGTLLGGAFFHMIPEAAQSLGRLAGAIHFLAFVSGLVLMGGLLVWVQG